MIDIDDIEFDRLAEKQLFFDVVTDVVRTCMEGYEYFSKEHRDNIFKVLKIFEDLKLFEVRNMNVILCEYFKMDVYWDQIKGGSGVRMVFHVPNNKLEMMYKKINNNWPLRAKTYKCSTILWRYQHEITKIERR